MMDRCDDAIAATGTLAPATRERIVDSIPADLEAEWGLLVDNASEPNAFAEPWFVAASLAHLREEPVRLIEVRRAGRLIGLFMAGVEPSYDRVPFAHVQNWRHHHHFLGTPLIASGEEGAFWEALLAHLDAAPWAANFLHLVGLVEDGPVLAALRAAGRPCPVVYREVRATLASDLQPDAYYEHNVRKKKRKELARLRNRIAELGEVTTAELTNAADLDSWCDDFLALERSGWKGENGSALGCTEATEQFFRAAVSGAQRSGRLQFLRLAVAGKPVAMLVNFLTPPGSFSFKTAYDESYGRFSPGVLLQRANLDILGRPDIAWMDSCAAPDHPMIDSLWAERRTVVRVTVPLAGTRRRLAYNTARLLEESSALCRRLARRVRG
ncbi:MAG TPA: GNAT family N-acetyltransferase [Allosphingosinicella sp.]